jgi:hypothetical protein
MLRNCQDCKEQLGEEFKEVNIWLDELFKSAGPDHRDIRHNNLGIEKCRKMWGDKAAEAATIHILADEGKIPQTTDLIFIMRLAMKPHIYEAFSKEYENG